MTHREPLETSLKRLNGRAIGMSPAIFARRLGATLNDLEAVKERLAEERRQGLTACRDIEAWNQTHPRRTRRGNR